MKLVTFLFIVRVVSTLEPIIADRMGQPVLLDSPTHFVFPFDFSR